MLDRTLESILALYDSSLAPERWTEGLDAMTEAVGCKGALLMGMGADGLDYRLQSASSMWAPHAALAPVWRESYGQIDVEAQKRLFKQPLGVPLFDEEIWPDDDLWNRDDMRFLRENVGTFLRMSLNFSSHGVNAGVTLYFDQSVQQIGTKTRETAGLIAPHATQAIRINRLHHDLLLQYQAVLSVLDRVRMGIAVVARTGDIVVVNETACGLLESRGAVRLRSDRRLEIANEDASRTLQHCLDNALATAIDGKETAEAVVRIPRGPGREPLLLEILPLRDGRGEIEVGFAGALIYFIDPEQVNEFDLSPLRHAFQLTPAEMAVTEKLVIGHTIGEIAEMRGVSFHTVQAQTRAIYRKTRARSRGEIARRALTLKPPLS